MVWDRYLKLLGIRPKEPSFDSLTEIIRAHLLKIPFENLSKLYFLKTRNLRGIPDIDLYLDGIERYHFGGTCYTTNYYFHLLLKHLGYTTELCGADMDQPDVHLVNRVTLDGKEYLVDVGYAAPFGEPMPLYLNKDLEIHAGSDRYVLSPKDSDGCSEMKLYRNGSLHHGYRVKPGHREIDYFRHIIADSFLPSSTFMNCILLVKYTGEKSIVIHNMAYLERAAGHEVRREFKTRNEMLDEVELNFKISKPITHEALEEMTITGDAWH
jgi:arylamine N-acetyltransferase